MPNRKMPFQRAQIFFVENLRYQPHLFMHIGCTPITGGDSRAFLPAMLQGIQAEKVSRATSRPGA